MNIPESTNPDRRLPGYRGLYKGRVEQRNDPQRLGRLKIRVEGIFTEALAVDELPWYWPRTQAWKTGGLFFIPPVGEYVWVQMEGGDYEYGVWDHGFWGQGDTAQGVHLAVPAQPATETSPAVPAVMGIRQWPSSWFGSQKAWEDGPLKGDLARDARPDDAPNVFGFTSPLWKRVELDDRRDREKLLLADRHDNFLWLNSEDGVLTLEAAGGNRSPSYFPRGLTLSSNAREQKLTVQVYTFRGWLLTIDDVLNSMEIAAPSGNKFRLSDGDQKRAELWVGPLRVVLDESTGSVQASTGAGTSLTLTGESVLLRAGPRQFVRMNLSDGSLELSSEGNLTISAAGDITLAAGGSAIVNGGSGVFLNTLPSPETAAAEELPAHTLPDTLERIARACDSPYYGHPERVPEPAPATTP